MVDKFCRCVKKVKKTFRSEGPAIAVCTKSVLQKRHRTLRKVRCRKHMLETQPMKGGELIAGGADTLVFYDPKLEDDGVATPEQYPVPDKPEKNDHTMKLIQEFNAVVRMICTSDNEYRMHQALKEWSKKDGGYLNSFITMHMNLWVDVYKVNVAETEKNVIAQGQNIDKWEKVLSKWPGGQWYGLITRYQGNDLADIHPDERVHSLCDLLRTLIHIDGRFVHTDLHMGNAAQMLDGTTVLHDFGRARFRDYLQTGTRYQLTYPSRGNKGIFRNELFDILIKSAIPKTTAYMLSFDQLFFIARYFSKEGDNIAGDVDEWLDTSAYIVPKDGDDVAKINESNKIKNRRVKALQREDIYVYSEEFDYNPADRAEKTVKPNSDVPTPYYLDPVYETRYHHLARVFDILSVLRAFELGSGKKAAEAAAKKLLHMIHGTPRYEQKYGYIPSASAEEVEKVVNDCIAEVNKEIGGGSPYVIKQTNEEIEIANKYWAEKEQDKPRKKSAARAPAPVQVAPEIGGNSEMDLGTWDGEYTPPANNSRKSATEFDITDKDIKRAETLKEPVQGGHTFRRKQLPRLL